MVPTMDQEAVRGAMDGTNDGLGSSRRSDGSGSSRRNDGWYQRWISKQLKERWMVPPVDQKAIEGAMDSINDGSGSSRRCDGSGCSRWINKDNYLY